MMLMVVGEAMRSDWRQELQQLERARLCDRLGAALHRQLAENIRDMLLGSAQANDQALGDLVVGGAIGEQPQHLQLARGQQLDQN